MAPSSNVARERSTTFGQLQESYDANQSAAIDWLKKGPITFVGKIDMIVANGHKDVLVVTFSSGDADGIHVAFYYREQFRAQVDSLYSGEDVRLTGSFMFKGDLDSLNFEGTGIEAFGDAAS